MPLKGRKKLDKAIQKRIKEKDNALRSVFYNGLKGIVVGTPIDEGRVANNWFLTLNTPFKGSSELTSGNDNPQDKMPKSVIGKRIFFTNNMPYINALEYGGYPNPAKRGSWDKVKKAYVINTLNGFAKSAGQGGWVRKELLVMRKAIRGIK